MTGTLYDRYIMAGTWGDMGNLKNARRPPGPSWQGNVNVQNTEARNVFTERSEHSPVFTLRPVRAVSALFILMHACLMGQQLQASSRPSTTRSRGRTGAPARHADEGARPGRLATRDLHHHRSVEQRAQPPLVNKNSARHACRQGRRRALPAHPSTRRAQDERARRRAPWQGGQGLRQRDRGPTTARLPPPPPSSLPPPHPHRLLLHIPQRPPPTQCGLV